MVSGAWSPIPGPGNGKLVFNVDETLTVGTNTKIQMNGRGWAGGAAYTSGSSYTGPGISSGSNNGGGGGAGVQAMAGQLIQAQLVTVVSQEITPIMVMVILERFMELQIFGLSFT